MMELLNKVILQKRGKKEKETHLANEISSGLQSSYPVVQLCL